jgi:protein-disulfide isomerase
MVEFTDYQCPFCRIFNREIFPKMRKEYIDTGKVRFVSLDLPLEQHSDAMKAAEAVRCAGDQGKYWELRAAILGDPRSPSENIIVEAARTLSLDPGLFNSCFGSGSHRTEIEGDQADAAFLQINGTPTFVLGKISQGNLNGTLVRGVLQYAALQQKLDELLGTGAG